MGRMSRKLLLIGDGGHCRSVYDTVCAMGSFDEIGVIGRDLPQSDNTSSLPVIGCDDDLPRLYEEGWKEAFIALGSIGTTEGRRRLVHSVEKIGFTLPTIVDPSAVIAEGVELAEGVFVGKRAVINSGTEIGQSAIINTGAIIEHDCSIGTFAHISSGAILCGGVSIGKDAHIGAGSVVRQMVSIGDRVMVGIGSGVVKDIPADVTAYGNPCRVVTE